MSARGRVISELEALREAELANPALNPRSLTRWWIAQPPRRRAIVLLHGFTNAPPQYDVLAPMLVAAGWDVIVPRFPYHGYADRMTGAPRYLTRDDFLITPLRAVVLAARLGGSVDAGGISLGATVACWIAQHVRLHTILMVAPAFGLKNTAGPIGSAIFAGVGALPNMFLWWDPFERERTPPAHGYPRFSTHALALAMHIGDEIRTSAGAGRFMATRLALAISDAEPIMNNAESRSVCDRFGAAGVDVRTHVFTGLPKRHDIIEPSLEGQPIDVVYPALIRLLS